jgi:hypothetical protein
LYKKLEISWFFLPVILRDTCLFSISSIWFYLLNVQRRCWLIGPRCESPYRRNVWYFDNFLPVIL